MRVLGLVAAATALLWVLRVPYLAQQGWFQLELLRSRVPVEVAIRTGAYDAEQVRKLHLIAEVKRRGAGHGLAASDNYDSIAHGWSRTIFNVSACAPDSFEAHTTWFPITGSISYLGFFRAVDAQRQADRFTARGLDVYVRTAGAYSTLGWFRDPILPGMLQWSDSRLAEVILHELTHATVWVAGAPAFNESLAQFVGEHAAMDWLRATHGPDSEPVRQEQRRRLDRDEVQAELHRVYRELDRAYSQLPTRRARLDEKARILSRLPERIEELGLPADSRAATSALSGDWNNARFLQLRTYNAGAGVLERHLTDSNGELATFLQRIEALTAGAADPWEALEQPGRP